MLKNKIWLGVILSIILLVFGINGFATDYEYTQESGTGFFVGFPDKSDAQEDTNEIRQIVNDLGSLLGHSKMDGLYPKDLTTGGYLGRLNSGLDASKPAVPVVNDMYLATNTVKIYRCFVAGNWVQIYPSTIENNVTKTGDFTAGKIAKINNASGIIEEGTNTDADVVDAVTKKHTSGDETCIGDVSGTVGANTVDKIKGHTVDETDIGDNKLLVYKTTGDKYVYETLDLSLYYLKTEINTLSKVETIYTKDITDSDELATALADYYLKTAIDTQGEMETIWGTTLQPLDTALTNISALVYVSPSFIKLTADDIYAVRTINEVITDLALDSDDLSDVASIAMLDENESVAGTWMVAGSIGGVDTTEFGYLADISAFGASIIDDADEATFKATVNLEIGTDVLAYQTIGIANDNLIEMDDADAAVDDYCKLTANGIVGRSYSEVKTDLSLNYVENLKVKLDGIQAPTVNNDTDEGYAVGSRWFDVTNDKEYVCLDNTDGAAVWTETTAAGGGYTNLTSFVEQTAWRLFYANADGDVIEIALGADGTYLGSNGPAAAPTFGTPSGAGDMLKVTYDNDEDGDIDVAAGGTEKSLWTLYAIPYLSGTTAFGEIPIGTAGQVLKVSAGATGYEFANESDPTVDTDAELKAILSDEVTKTGDFTAGRMAIINNASGIIEQGTNTDTDVADAVTKRHAQNTDTILVLTNALGSDQTYSGETDSQPVGETVAFGEILYLNWADKEWKKAKADAFVTAYGTRIALEAKNDGQTCLMLVKGYIREDTLFDFGAVPIFLNDDTAGRCDDIAPAESGDQIFKVGEAKDIHILFFDPGKDVGEI